MSTPLFVISTFRVMEGKQEQVEQYYKKVLGLVEANEPQIIAFHGFLNEDGTEMTSIQVHPDAGSMDFHMQVLRENWDETFSEYGQMLESITVAYYGTPPASALAMDIQSERGLVLNPQHLAGFTRTATG